ncbi:MAG: hypothetical protein AAGD14_19645 [Planctomycetota bacterium]
MGKLLGLATLILCTACSTPESRIEDNQALFDAYSPEDQSAIRSGQIRQGFDQNQVYMALGKPSKKKAEDGQESWLWLKSESRSIEVEKDVNKYALERNEYEQGKRASAPSTTEQVFQTRTRVVKVVNFMDGKVNNWEDPVGKYTGEWQ